MNEKAVEMSTCLAWNCQTRGLQKSLSLPIRSLYGSSFITKYRGQRANFDDLNTGMPSVFQISEMFLSSDSIPLVPVCL